MQSSFINTKEAIRNRMLKHAITFWDIKNPEDLDPAVKLILESLSLELYNLGNEQKDSQVRILEKVSNLLAPDSLTSPNPAHAILHGTPIEPVESVSRTNSFYAQRKISSKQNEELDTTLELYFTPVDAVQLFDISISYIISGNSLFSYGKTFAKQWITRCQQPLSEANTVWLGLKVNPQIESIAKLNFAFDLKSVDQSIANEYFQLLSLTRWFVRGEEINVNAGLNYERSRNEGGLDNIFIDHDLTAIKERDIKNIYDRQFVCISDSCTSHLAQLGSSRPQFLDPSLIGNQDLFWVKVVFPAAMPQQYLDDLYVYPNSFPVVNRKLVDLKYRLKGQSNIIPLRTEALDQFLSVRSVADDRGDYRAVPFRSKTEEQAGTYTLRNGGVERFDSRNAKEMISYLLELLRSESAAFSAYGYDFIATTLKELNQKISLMEQKTQGTLNGGIEIPHYIIVKPNDGNEMMHVHYWTTLAEVGNSLRAGTKLQQARGTKLANDSIILVTTTSGGKNRLKPEEKLNAFRYGLISRNRIVTKEDIRTFGFHEFGDQITNIDIKKGFSMSMNPSSGFQRTIDVIVTPAPKSRLDPENWEILLNQFKAKLETRSGVTNNYRVLLNASVYASK